MKTRNRNHYVLMLVALFISSVVCAQGDKSNRASPPAKATGKIGAANITIDYSSPSVRDRKIFPDMHPYGEVWRAGANEATVFETDKDIRVEGKTLPKGKYSIYAIPGEKEWTVIFNKQTGQWGVKRGGATSRDPEQDALLVKVKPKKTSLTERLVYEVNNNGIVLKWEYVEVPVSIKG